MATAVPPEICGLICSQPTIHNRDLRVLCGVSKAFRDEAERLLHAYVTLRKYTHIKSWCITIARRPHLAQRVKSLSLTFPPQTSIEPADLSLIMHGLHLCVNLRDLSTLKHDQRIVGMAVQTWILDGHKFKLEKFTNNYFRPHLLFQFFSSQPLLQFLSLRSTDPANIVESTFPNLRTVDTSGVILRELGNITWSKRDIHHLQYYMTHPTDDEELQNFVALTQFAGALVSLSVERHAGRHGLEIAIMVACIAAQLPDLKFLQIVDYTDLPEPSVVPLLPFPIRFNKIETLVLHPARVVLEGDDQAYPELQTAIGRLSAALRITTNLPTLKQLVFVTTSVFIFSRLEDGQISLEERETYDDHAWMKV